MSNAKPPGYAPPRNLPIRTPPRKSPSSQASPPVQPQPTPKPPDQPQPTLRVMRLYKPRLHFAPPLPYSNQVDMLQGGGVDSSASKLLLGRRESDFALSSCLILPDSFGSIYRGETFCAYVSVLNHLPVNLKDVKVGAKLVTPASKRNLPLADCRLERGAQRPGASSAALLHSGEKLDMVVQSTLSELGDYTLKVTVEYFDLPKPKAFTPAALPGSLPPPAHLPLASSIGASPPPLPPPGHQPPSSPPGTTSFDAYGQPIQAAAAQVPPVPEEPVARTLRKYYRFKVAAPLEVTSVSRVVGGRGFVEATLRNATAGPLLISAATFVAAEGYVSTDLTPPKGGTTGVGGGAVAHQLSPDSILGDLGLGGESSEEEEEEWEDDGMNCLDALDRHLHLAAGDTHQLLFMVTSNAPESVGVAGAGGGGGGVEAAGQGLGSVAVQWRTALGETGSFKAPPVPAPTALRREVEVSLAPSAQSLLRSLVVGGMATVPLRISNNTDRTLSLQLRWRLPAGASPAHTGFSAASSSAVSKAGVGGKKSAMPTSSAASAAASSSPSSMPTMPMPPGIVLHGAASARLGAVPRGGASVETEVTLLALNTGLHPILGLVVVDENSGREYPQPSLATVLVLTPKEVEAAAAAAAASSFSSSSQDGADVSADVSDGGSSSSSSGGGGGGGSETGAESPHSFLTASAPILLTPQSGGSLELMGAADDDEDDTSRFEGLLGGSAQLNHGFPSAGSLEGGADLGASMGGDDLSDMFMGRDSVGRPPALQPLDNGPSGDGANGDEDGDGGGGGGGGERPPSPPPPGNPVMRQSTGGGSEPSNDGGADALPPPPSENPMMRQSTGGGPIPSNDGGAESPQNVASTGGSDSTEVDFFSAPPPANPQMMRQTTGGGAEPSNDGFQSTEGSAFNDDDEMPAFAPLMARQTTGGGLNDISYDGADQAEVPPSVDGLPPSPSLEAPMQRQTTGGGLSDISYGGGNLLDLAGDATTPPFDAGGTTGSGGGGDTSGSLLESVFLDGGGDDSGDAVRPVSADPFADGTVLEDESAGRFVGPDDNGDVVSPASDGLSTAGVLLEDESAGGFVGPDDNGETANSEEGGGGTAAEEDTPEGTL